MRNAYTSYILRTSFFGFDDEFLKHRKEIEEHENSGTDGEECDVDSVENEQRKQISETEKTSALNRYEENAVDNRSENTEKTSVKSNTGFLANIQHLWVDDLIPKKIFALLFMSGVMFMRLFHHIMVYYLQAYELASPFLWLYIFFLELNLVIVYMVGVRRCSVQNLIRLLVVPYSMYFCVSSFHKGAGYLAILPLIWIVIGNILAKCLDVPIKDEHPFITKYWRKRRMFWVKNILDYVLSYILVLYLVYVIFLK